VAVVGCGNVPNAEVDAGMDAAIDAPAGSTSYRGTLEMTAAFPFGGSPYCNYTQTLRQITLSIAVSKTGAIVDASGENLAVEATVPPCSQQPIPPQLHKYKFASATPAGGAVNVIMTQAPANTPKTSLVMTVTPGGGGYTVAARWTRTDQQPPLAWSVTATMPLLLAQ
jgi:hypothetical protein